MELNPRPHMPFQGPESHPSFPISWARRATICTQWETLGIEPKTLKQEFPIIDDTKPFNPTNTILAPKRRNIQLNPILHPPFHEGDTRDRTKISSLISLDRKAPFISYFMVRKATI